jgi:hypothetical protein
VGHRNAWILPRAGWLACLAFLTLAETAPAQDRPFGFTVTTGTSVATTGSEGRSWTTYYDAGYAERTAEPFGYDGVEQRFGVQGRLGGGFTVLGQVGLGLGADATRSSQQAELLKDLLGPKSGLRLAVGLGARREWEGTSAALARVCLGWSHGGSLFSGNVLLERPFGSGRDAVDVLITVGWLQGVGRGLRLGVEAVGEDLEGFWEAEEAEGGAKLFVGPALHWAAPTGRLWLSAGGGPVVYATHSDRSSPAPRPLGANGNGYTLRVSMGYRF